MSAVLALERTPVISVGGMLRLVEQAMRDRTWEHSPVGREVAAFMRALRWRSESEATHRSYEGVLALFALRHDDWPSLDEFCNAAGVEYLREFLDAEWGSASAATKRQRAAIVRSATRFVLR